MAKSKSRCRKIEVIGGIADGPRRIASPWTKLFLAPNSHSDGPTEVFTLTLPVRGVFLGDEVRVELPE